MNPRDTPNALAMAPFHGVAPEALYAIGCITTAAGELEWLAREMLRNLYAVPGKGLLGAILKRIRAQVQDHDAMPGHARVDPEEVIAWTHEVQDVLAERHEITHSVPLKQARQSYGGDLTWEAVSKHLRTGALAALGADDLMGTARAIARVGTSGGELCRALMLNPRRGVYLPNTVLDSEWIPTCALDETFEPVRPTEAEMDAWWREFGPIPLLGSAPPI